MVHLYRQNKCRVDSVSLNNQHEYKGYSQSYYLFLRNRRLDLSIRIVDYHTVYYRVSNEKGIISDNKRQ